MHLIERRSANAIIRLSIITSDWGYMELNLVYTMIGMGIVLLFIAAMAMLMLAQLRRCTAKMNATITNIKRQNRHYYPVYEYYVNGVRYARVGTACTRSSMQVGSTISIAYNPQEPQQSHIPGHDDKTYKFVAIVCIIIGLIPLIGGICMALLI